MLHFPLHVECFAFSLSQLEQFGFALSQPLGFTLRIHLNQTVSDRCLWTFKVAQLALQCFCFKLQLLFFVSQLFQLIESLLSQLDFRQVVLLL